MRNLRSRLVRAIAGDFIFLCPHAGRAHTFLKLKKYAKKFCRKLRLPRQCKAKVELCQFSQLPLWAILLH